MRGGLDAGRGRLGRPSSDPGGDDVAWAVIWAEGERVACCLSGIESWSGSGECLRGPGKAMAGALVVEGPAGIGKTVLLAAGRDVAEGEDFRVLRARGAELEREFAFGVVRQLVEPVGGGGVAAGADRAVRWGRRGCSPVAGPSWPSDDGTTTISPDAPDPSFAVLHGLYWLCANLAADRPMALVVDDAHWADGASLRFLAFLLPRLEELHVACCSGPARPRRETAGAAGRPDGGSGDRGGRDRAG